MLFLREGRTSRSVTAANWHKQIIKTQKNPGILRCASWRKNPSFVIHPFPKKSSPFTVQSAYAPKWLTHPPAAKEWYRENPTKKTNFLPPLFWDDPQRVHFPHAIRMFRLQITGSPPCVPSTTRKNFTPSQRLYHDKKTLVGHNLMLISKGYLP